MEEIWKDIPSYEGFYQASNLGNIRNKKCHILKPQKDHRGYLQVLLYKDKKPKCFRIHRLVWLAFKGPIPEGMEINHLDECKTNNNLENLSLVTRTENMNWGTQITRSAKSRTNGKCSKTILQYDLYGNFICEWVSQQEIARQTGFNRGNISSCCLGKLNSANGYIWRFK